MKSIPNKIGHNLMKLIAICHHSIWYLKKQFKQIREKYKNMEALVGIFFMGGIYKQMRYKKNQSYSTQ